MYSNQGFVIRGSAEDQRLGWSMAVGDFNGDSVADIAVSSINDSPGGDDYYQAGSVWVIYGAPLARLATNVGFVTVVDELDVNSGAQLTGAAAGYLFGRSVTVGDVNSDGVGDLIVGDSDSGRINPAMTNRMLSRTGMVAVYYGECNSQKRFSESVKRLSGDNGFIVQSLTAGDQLGFVVSTAGGNVYAGAVGGGYVAEIYGSDVVTLACPKLNVTRYLPEDIFAIGVGDESDPGEAAGNGGSGSNPTTNPGSGNSTTGSGGSNGNSGNSTTGSGGSNGNSGNSTTGSGGSNGNSGNSTTGSGGSNGNSGNSTTGSGNSGVSGPPVVYQLSNNSTRINDIVNATSPKYYEARMPCGTPTFSIDIAENSALEGSDSTICVYERANTLPTTTTYDALRCSSYIQLQVSPSDSVVTKSEKRDVCDICTYYFLVTTRTVSSYNITVDFDAGCDGCGGSSDVCGDCIHYGAIGNGPAGYRGFDSDTLDRSLTAFKLLRLQQVLENLAASLDSASSRLLSNYLSTASQVTALLNEAATYETEITQYSDELESLLETLSTIAAKRSARDSLLHVELDQTETIQRQQHIAMRTARQHML
eukprot:TRINITY_DN3239_c0_g1_i1.p1 TRINITY_DN3239_c0_g1~~TRINITY_DN3239_c0_g1_i1.p1  ORF type:complete len:591 (-),score=92.28 TRINITY_DN3239_c0_g1_i1:145-1917(-)